MMKSSDISKASNIVNEIVDMEHRVFRIDEYYKPKQTWWLMHNDNYVMLDEKVTAEIMQLVKTRLKERKEELIKQLSELDVEYTEKQKG